MTFTLYCDHCSQRTTHKWSMETVRPHGERIVYTCTQCNISWIPLLQGERAYGK